MEIEITDEEGVAVLEAHRNMSGKFNSVSLLYVIFLRPISAAGGSACFHWQRFRHTLSVSFIMTVHLQSLFTYSRLSVLLDDPPGLPWLSLDVQP